MMEQGAAVPYAGMFAQYSDLMTPAQVAHELNMTPQQVNNLCRAGKIPCVQVSERKRVIPKAVFIEWIMQGGNRKPEEADTYKCMIFDPRFLPMNDR